MTKFEIKIECDDPDFYRKFIETIIAGNEGEASAVLADNSPVKFAGVGFEAKEKFVLAMAKRFLLSSYSSVLQQEAMQLAQANFNSGLGDMLIMKKEDFFK